MTSRKIIYVDAAYQNTVSSVSLYETEISNEIVTKVNNSEFSICKTEIGYGIVTKVNNSEFNIKDNNQAESLAVFQAILYIKKQGYKKAIILCDNENVAKKYANHEKGIRVVWIPREINIVADKLTKLENNTSEKDINLLKYLFAKMGKK